MPGQAGPGSPGPGEPRAGGKLASEPSLFTPGYSGGRASRRDAAHVGSGWADSGQHGAGQYGSGPYGAGQYLAAPGSAAGKGPIRGFPPAPGQPPPLYPPGQFSAWNHGSWPADNGYADPGAANPDSGAWPTVDRGAPEAAGPGQARPGHEEPDYISPAYADAGYADAAYADPDYSALAVSDPAADVTSTQTWDVVDDDASGASGWSDLSSSDERGRHAGSYARRMPPDLAPADEELLRQAIPGPAGPGPAGPGLGAPGLGAPGGAALRPAGPGPAGPGGTAPGRVAPRRDQPDDWEDPPLTRDTRSAPERVADPVPGTGPRPVQEPDRRQSTRGHGSRGRARPRGRKRRGRVLLAAALAVAVVAGAGYLLLAGRHQQGPTAALHPARPKPSPTGLRPSPSPSLGIWGHIASRASDPLLLTLTELFPARFADAGIAYTRTVQKARGHCSGALIGSALPSAVSHAGCTQVMRASYLSSGNKMMGTIGVLNLATAGAAEKAGKAAGPAEFIAQLPAATGPTKRLTKGTGIEAAEVKGHYLVLVWAEFANLRAPKSAAQRRELEAFISVLIQKTANVSLANRMVTGRPAT